MARLTLAAVAASLASAAASTVIVTVTSNAVSVPMPGNAAGFSYEVGCVPGMVGNATQGPRKSFVNLMNNLKAAAQSAAGPELRIGGNSADTSAYVPNVNQPLPNGTTYRITNADFAAYAAAVPLWAGTITPGVNFRFPDTTAYPLAHAQAVAAHVPASILRAFEIGNECDLYHGNGIRAPDYTRFQYEAEWNAYRTALRAAVPGTPIQGGTFCCNQTGFDLSTPGLLPLSSTWSEHFYPLSVCNHKHNNSVWDLLADAAAQKEALAQAPLAARAQALGVPYYLAETNSISCGGQYGVSDTFAATLWAVDMMFNGAAVNITGFRFHGCAEGAYTAIAYNDTTDIQNAPTVRPLYYALWAFSAAIANEARVVAAPYTSDEPQLKVWAARSTAAAAAPQTRVVLIHKNGNATAPAQAIVKPEGAGTGPAQLFVLAPSAGGVFAKEGLSFAGQTFDGSADGLPIGTMTPVSVPLGTDGAYHFSVAPASIALLQYSSPAASAAAIA